MNERFQPEWFTIPEFAKIKPRCMYHKENAGGSSDGCTAGAGADEWSNLHVLARAEYFWENGSGKGRAIRREMQAEAPETRVLLRVTADDYYKLYVNGRYAGQGPAPAYPEHYYYNELDITPYLQPGRNVLAVHFYYQGLVNRVWNSGDARFGIACDIREIRRGEKETVTGMVPRWRYQVSCAYSGGITGYDTQFLEDFDSRRWEESWKETAFDDQMWRPMVKAEWADYQCSAQPVEMLSVYRQSPREMRKLPDGWLIDMGQEITGSLLIRAEAENSGDRIVIQCGEELEDRAVENDKAGKNDRAGEHGREGAVRYEMRCNCRYEETWTLKQGICSLEPYDYKGFRYARLICDPGITVLQAEAEIRHYPMDETLCTLSSDDAVLDGIFQICKQGVKCGTQEGYLDCPTREKGLNYTL